MMTFIYAPQASNDVLPAFFVMQKNPSLMKHTNL